MGKGKDKTHKGGAHAVRSFHDGLCDCCSGPGGMSLCCLSVWCCPCSVAKLYDSAKHGTEHTGCCPCGPRPNCCCHDKYAFFCIICTLGVGAWCVLCKARHKARERYDMSQEANCCSCSDKCVVAFCPCCALVQTANHLIAEGVPARLAMTEYDLPSRFAPAAAVPASAAAVPASAAPPAAPHGPAPPRPASPALRHEGSTAVAFNATDLDAQFTGSQHDLHAVAVSSKRTNKKDYSVVFK